MAWGGWLFAAGVLVVRGNRRIRAITLFAVVTACSIYAGHPETLIVMAGAMLVFLIVVLALRAMPSRLGLGAGPIRRPVLDLGIATVAGGALGAPLLLPALQLTAASVRTDGGAASRLFRTAAGPKVSRMCRIRSPLMSPGCHQGLVAFRIRAILNA